MDEQIRVLVVDDDPDVAFSTARVIRSQGFEIKIASSGAECRERIEIFHPDLILLDVVLPDANGAELCRDIKAGSSPAPYIILISGMKTSSEQQAGGLDNGADGYIARPVSNRELASRVNAMVRILTAERQRDRAIADLEKALGQIKQLKGLVPICSHCKKIRNDTGFWDDIEAFLEEQSDLELSHGICPKCADAHYPDLDLYDDQD